MNEKLLEDMTEPELAFVMSTMARLIENAADVLRIERPLFALILFNDPEVSQYIANCQRSDVIKAMRECADRLESKETVERNPFPNEQRHDPSAN